MEPRSRERGSKLGRPSAAVPAGLQWSRVHVNAEVGGVVVEALSTRLASMEPRSRERGSPARALLEQWLHEFASMEPRSRERGSLVMPEVWQEK